MPKSNQKMRVTVLTILIVTLFSLQPTFISYAESLGQAAYADKLATFLQRQMERYMIPGLAIAIVRNGEVEYLEGFGIANDRGEAITPDTPFLLASVSKSMTAVGIMQLVEAGKLELNDPVQKYLPWFEVAGGAGPDITVAYLLYHTSGLPELAGNEANDSPNSLEDGTRALAGTKLDFIPGHGWEYSNLNYNTLGLLIQEVSGMSYEAYIEEHIFAPLGMKNSYTSLVAARAEGAASGYYPFFGVSMVFDEYMPYSSAALPSAGIWSSASDMSRYLIAQLNDGQYGSAALLSTAGMEKLHTPGVEIEPGYSYAMGWFHAPGFLDREFLQTLETDLKQYDDQEVLWHEGDWPNYKSMALLLPGLDYGVIILMNSNDSSTSSVLKNFAWDVTLIATNGEAYYFQPTEAFIVRHGRWIFSGVTLLLLVAWMWSFRTLKRTRSTGRAHPLQMWGPLAISAALFGYLYLKLLPENAANLPLLLKSRPDFGILLLFITLFSIGWSTVGVLLFIAVRKKQK